MGPCQVSLYYRRLLPIARGAPRRRGDLDLKRLTPGSQRAAVPLKLRNIPEIILRLYIVLVFLLSKRYSGYQNPQPSFCLGLGFGFRALADTKDLKPNEG